MRALALQTGPATEVLSVLDAKAHLRVTTADEDAYIEALVGASRTWFEEQTSRALITQTWDLWLDGWPFAREIELPRPPLQTVTSVVYYDQDDAEATFASSNYLVDADATIGRVILNATASWPTTSLRPAKGVRVRFVAGQGDDVTDVSEIDRMAVRLLVSHFFELREPMITGTIVSEVPMGLRSIIWRDRAQRTL